MLAGWTGPNLKRVGMCLHSVPVLAAPVCVSSFLGQGLYDEPSSLDFPFGPLKCCQLHVQDNYTQTGEKRRRHTVQTQTLMSEKKKKNHHRCGVLDLFFFFSLA